MDKGSIAVPDSMRRWHIAVICPALGGVGAVANVALHQARELARQFDVTLVSENFPADIDASTNCLKLSPRHFSFLRRFAHVPNEIAFTLAARKAVEKLHAISPVSLVICHGHPVATLAAYPLQKSLGIPYALVTHGDIFDRPNGTYDPRQTWFYRRMTPPAYRNADLIVALSPYMEKLAIRGGARPENTVVIPNGIDPADIGLDEAAPPLPRQITGRLELLYVGRLSVEKGVDVLVEAAALLRDRGVRFRLRVVGSGVQEKALRELVARLRLDGMVEFAGPRPRKELGALYRTADVLCVPSLSEPFGIVVLEAMASGVAVVGANIGGIPYMVRQGVTGLCCKAAEPLALADALQSISSNPALAVRMGMAGRLRAEQEFGWEVVGKRLADAIGLIIDNKSGS